MIGGDPDERSDRGPGRLRAGGGGGRVRSHHGGTEITEKGFLSFIPPCLRVSVLNVEPRMDIAIPFVYSYRTGADGVPRHQFPEPEGNVQDIPVDKIVMSATAAILNGLFTFVKGED